ncbi:AAA-domain-containing protein [Gymnopus androsaceus JB14]|uniref:AAA-domain-containing protein n=1 Tax=Gymnopus androsaceus JB14 TaxID=1447944 RepID=A0A6A4I3Q9_9AGAR|nr:AAA-domain-containing protein [Gymnopus androsaceus JB14]
MAAPVMGLRRSSRHRGPGSDDAGPSGSEYQQSERSFHEEPVDEEEEEEPAIIEKIKTKRGRTIAKKSYVESNDEDEDADADGDPDVDGGDLFDFKDTVPQRTTRRSTRASGSAEAGGETSGLRRSARGRNLDFIDDDDDNELNDDDEAEESGRPRTRSRLTRNKPVPQAPALNGRTRSSHNRSRTRTTTQDPLRRSSRRSKSKATANKKEDDYNPGSGSGSGSSVHSGDADGSDVPARTGARAEPEEDGGTDGNGKPYALRRRAKINYAIPPPLEDLSRPPPQKGNRNNGGGNGRAFGGRAGYGGHGGGHGYGGGKKKGLGWSASGAELGKWMGLNGDDSDSDAPTRTPRKAGPGSFGLSAAGGAGLGFDGGLLPGDLAASGTPTNANLGSLGKVDAASLADADPLGVNVNVTFDEIGGLDDHINSLKEMTLLPLLYPELFQQFNVTPPRGVLFHGPPGTGKTLMARALAASCRKEGKEITFFMRKGADALSKWVGEAERQLRLLFTQARASAPSIIFFDEIDGLAPVRSSKQDQIHSSIVSTLLALMDGMDGRGQVVVIGATNRVDSVDPALRRPGRFDREFYFPLPTVEAREKILGIMTKGWKGWGSLVPVPSKRIEGSTVPPSQLIREGSPSQPPKRITQGGGTITDATAPAAANDLDPTKKNADMDMDKDEQMNDEEKDEKEQQLQKAQERIKGLAKLTKGYGGADLRALCTEAALNAIQRKYPQIYKSNDRLLLKPEEIEVGLKDFMISVKRIIPSSARSSASSASPLPPQFVPLLSQTLDRAREVMGKVLPVEKKLTALEEAEYEQEDYGSSPAEGYGNGFGAREKYKNGGEEEVEREMGMQSMEILRIHRPRMVLHGPVGMGQNYVGAALLQHLEGYHIQSLELGTLMGDSARTVEAALVQLFVEAKRHSPSVIYIPSLVGWCAAISETARSTVRAMLDTIAPTDPVLLLAIVDGSYASLPRDVRAWFGPSKHNRIELIPPSTSQRSAFFQPLLDDVKKPPNKFPGGVPRKKRVLEELPIAPPLEPRKPTEAELAVQVEQDLRTITILKYRLGPIMAELKRKFKRFTKRAREEYKEEFSYMESELELELLSVPTEGMGAVAQTMAVTIEIPDAPMDGSQNTQQPPAPLVNGHGQGINGVSTGIELVPVPMPTIDVANPYLTQPQPQTLPTPTEPEPQPQLFDMDLERMHENLYKDRYLTPNEFLEDIKKVVHNAAMYSHRDPDRHYKAQAMLTATEVSIQDFDPGLRVECERMAGRERKRRAEYKEKRAREKGKEKEKEKSSDIEQPMINGNGGTRRSARNNGQQPELAITDPVALERKLKRQRDGMGARGGSEEDSAAESRDAKRSRMLEDPNERDPLDIRTPPRQGNVRFASMDPGYPQQQGPSMFDAFQQQHQQLGSTNEFQQGASHMNMEGRQPFNSMPVASGSNLYPPSQPHPSLFPQHDSALFNQPQQSFHPHASPHHPAYSQQHPFSPHSQQHPFSPHSQPSFSQQVFSPSHPPFQPQPQFPQSPFREQPQFHQQAAYPLQVPGPSHYQSSSTPTPVPPMTQDAMVVDRPPSATRNSGVAMLLNPINPGEERVSSARPSPTPQNSRSHPLVPIPDNDDNPFLAVPVPHSHRTSSSASPHSQLQSILKSPTREKAPSPIPIIERTPTPLPDFHVDDVLVEQLHASLRESTSSLTIEELEQLRATCLGCIWRHRSEWDRDSLVRELQDLVSDFVAEVGDANTSDFEG